MHAEIKHTINQSLEFVPTDEQRKLIDTLTDFTFSNLDTRSCLLLKGYAGTGKTSIIGAFVKALQAVRKPFVLLAPTGRAAKVLSLNANYRAFTIHKFIYSTLR